MSEAGVVRRDDMEAAGSEGGDEIAPLVRRRREPAEQHDLRSAGVAGLPVEHVVTVNGGRAVLHGRGHDVSCRSCLTGNRWSIREKFYHILLTDASILTRDRVPVMDESPRSWVLPEEPVPVRLMGTIWADTDGLHDDLDTPFGLDAWMDAVGIQHSDTWPAPRSWQKLALRDSLRCLAAHQTDDTRPAAASRADLAWSVDVLNAAARLPAAQLRIENNTFRRATPNPTVSAALAGVATEAVDLFGGTSADELRACRPWLRPLLRQDSPPPRMVLYRLRQQSTRRTPLPPKTTGHGETQNELTRARSLPRRNRSFSGEPGDVDHPTVAVARTRSHRKLGSEADSHRGSGLVPRRRAVTPVLDSLEQGHELARRRQIFGDGRHTDGQPSTVGRAVGLYGDWPDATWLEVAHRQHERAHPSGLLGCGLERGGGSRRAHLAAAGRRPHRLGGGR